MAEDILKEEQQFVALLLNHPELVEDFQDSPLEMENFDATNRVIIHAIRDAYENDVKLTRKSFLEFINKIISKKQEIARLEEAFNHISYATANRNDYPMLKERILNSFLLRQSTQYVRDFAKHREDKSTQYAVKQLAASMRDLADSLKSGGKNKIVYEDLTNFGKVYYKEMVDIRAGLIPDAEFISYGIKELDETSGVGLAPGTMTLFCGDVGGYKSLVSSLLISTYEKGLLTVGEVYSDIKRGEILTTNQYESVYGKLVRCRILDAFDHGVMPCFRIKTALGHSIDCTAKHRNLTFDGYKRTKELVIGSYLAVNRWSISGEKDVSYEKAAWLGYMLSEGGTSQHGYTFANDDPIIVRDMKRASLNLGGRIHPQPDWTRCDGKGKPKKGRYNASGLRKLGIQYGLDGKLAIQKSVHREVFSWSNQSVAHMLRAMYSGDGRFHFEKSKIRKLKNGSGKRKYKIMYCTSSPQLAKDVRDLLLKFGLIASIYEFETWCTNCARKDKRPSWRVELSDAPQIVRFIKEIGFIGAKQKLAEEHLSQLEQIEGNPNTDVIPEGIWDLLEIKFKEYGKCKTGCRRHYRRGVHANWKLDMGHCGNPGKPMSRECLKKIVQYLDNDAELLAIAESDIYWDKIVSIESIGEQQTYDLEMPDDHNFVCNNIVTHNSTMMMNVALHVWWKEQKNVLYVPLEMPKKLVYLKQLSRQTQIPFELVNNPKSLSAEQMEKLQKYMEEEAPSGSAKIYLMDSYEQRTSVDLIRKMIERNLEIFKPRVVVVDYIANLTPDRKQDRADMDIGEMLKDLRYMGRPGVVHKEGFAIVSGAQIGREGLKRVRRSGNDKAMFYSEDLRGSHDYSADADVIYAQFPDPQQPDEKLQVFVVKSRYGKKTFPDGNRKAVFDLKPAISLIRSASDFYGGVSKDEILSKSAVDDVDLSFSTPTPTPTVSLDQDIDEMFGTTSVASVPVDDFMSSL